MMLFFVIKVSDGQPHASFIYQLALPASPLDPSGSHILGHWRGMETSS